MTRSLEASVIRQQFNPLPRRKGVVESTEGTNPIGQVGFGLANRFVAKQALVVDSGQVNLAQVAIATEQMNQQVSQISQLTLRIWAGVRGRWAGLFYLIIHAVSTK